MPIVNFIADPQEWMPSDGLKYLDPTWLANYSKFKGRLNWLLLWNDEVRIFDSFVLFNRQVERWIENARNERPSRDALERLFITRSLRVALRKGDANRTFATLQEIDAAHIRGNPNYRWYFDGPPSEAFVKLMDSYLGLPNPASSLQYESLSFGTKMKTCFNAAFDRTEGLESIYEAYGDLRKAMPTDAPERLRRLTHDEWRRSKLYTILGFGINQRGKLLPASRSVKDFSKPVRAKFRRLVDSVWYRTIDQSLGIPTRYPGTPPPAALWDAWKPPEREEDCFKQRDSDAEWVNYVLLDKAIGTAHIEGDVDRLFQGVANLDAAQVWQLRENSVFKEFRQKYNDFDSLDARHAFSDVALLNDIAKLTVKGLKLMGQTVGVGIEERGSGVVAIRFLSGNVAPKLFGYGLALVVGDPTILGVKTSLPAGLKVLGVEQGVKWLTTRFQRVGIPKRPLEIKATYIGPIRSND